MQTIDDLEAHDLSQLLADGGLKVRVGPYVYGIGSNLSVVADGLAKLYRNFPLAEEAAFVDFSVEMQQHGLVQRLRRQAEFQFDKKSPFDSIPTGQAYAFLEWGMNWCVSVHSNEYLKLHAGAVSREETAIILPGVPGAGKSTLCAALGLSGWRILSDEHALIPLNSTHLVPICRPVSLKNESIEAVKAFSSDAIFGPVSKETHKGVVAHMKADMHPDSHNSGLIPANIMLFPRYSRDEPQQLTTYRRSDSFILAAYHSFNYSLLCEAGFDAMKNLIKEITCYELVYHDLDWAVQTVDKLSGMQNGR
jgi:HprK-related kinase A